MNLIIKKNHNISQKKISKNSIKVIYRLNKLGYEAYLVGGSIRDLLLGRNPKDFDIATNAKPKDIRKLFKNCRLVGRRFIIAHLIFRKEIIEVSTFRAEQNNLYIHKKKNFFLKKNQNGMLLRDNKFGKIEEDAYRRDITINALYYSTKDFSIRDYVGGVNDIKSKIIRLIGDAETRYREDPVRMLRVIRFSVQLKMKISKQTAEPIPKLSNLLYYIPAARLFNEFIKLFCCGYGYLTYKKLKKYTLINPLFPNLKNIINIKNKHLINKMIIKTLIRIDNLIKNKKNFNLSFLFSSILWYSLTEEIQKIIIKKKIEYVHAYNISVQKVLKKSSSSIGIPKNVLLSILKIWNLQKDIERRNIYTYKDKKKNDIFINALELFYLRVNIEKKKEFKSTVKFWKEKY